MIESDAWAELSAVAGRSELWSLDYITQRLGELRGAELVERVPPEDSGLYRVTDLGLAALAIMARDGRTDIGFRELVEAADDSLASEGRGLDLDELPWADLVE